MNHPKRQSIICPSCKKLISRNESQCPYCGLSNPSSKMNRLFLNLYNHPEIFIKSIIGINIGMYVFSLLLGFSQATAFRGPLFMLSPDSRILRLIGATGSWMINGFQGWWTLIAANYLHGSILHILFNMIVFWQVCPLMLREYGASRTIIIYTLSGISGFVLSVFAGIPSTIGASAAICGLMGALIYYGKSRGGSFGQLIYKQIGGWVIGLFVLGLLFRGIGINNWAHAGGLVGGILSGFLLGYEERIREKELHRLLAKLVIVITVAILVWSLVRGLLIIFS